MGACTKNEVLIAAVTAVAEPLLRAAYQIKEKQARTEQLKAATYSCSWLSKLLPKVKLLLTLLKSVTSCLIWKRKSFAPNSEGEPRIDATTRTVRPITIRTGILPRTHGTALFTRGETQALVIATLGTARDEQKIDALMGEYSDRFMLHYNMPPFATGETGRVGTPKRREIGHGRLAKRALQAALPDRKISATPYVWFLKLLNPMVPLRWRPSAVAVWL
jgi:polyribonucleotide nucleotidyltransferase